MKTTPSLVVVLAAAVALVLAAVNVHISLNILDKKGESES